MNCEGVFTCCVGVEMAGTVGVLVRMEVVGGRGCPNCCWGADFVVALFLKLPSEVGG